MCPNCEHHHWATLLRRSEGSFGKNFHTALRPIGGPTAIDAGADIAQWSADRETEIAWHHDSPIALAPPTRLNGT
jgi:hypothetical protein